VTATGTAPLGYQWSKNGSAIRGATSSSYTTPATAAWDNGAQFTVVIATRWEMSPAAQLLSVNPAVGPFTASASTAAGLGILKINAFF